MTESQAYVAFNLTEKVGAATVAELSARAGSVAAAWEAYPKKVSRTGGAVDWEAEFAKAAKFGVQIVTPADKGYPKKLQGKSISVYFKSTICRVTPAKIS